MIQYFIHDLPEAAGITAPVSLTAYNPLGKKKFRTHILALGDVGTTMLVGLRLLGADVISHIGICDLNSSHVQRLEMEVNQIRYPFAGFVGSDMPVLPPVEIVDEARLFDCDVFIFCASKGVPPVGTNGDVRMAQLEANRSLVNHFAALAKAVAFKGLVCIVSDPIEPLCKAFWQASGLAPSQIQGYGLGVMNARAAYYAERNSAFALYLAEGRAFGPHGDGLVLADSIIAYHDDISKALTDKVVHANMAVRKLGYKPYIAPALSSAAISILLTLRHQWHYGSVYLGNAEKGAFFGIKNRMNEQGVLYEDVAVCAPLYERLKQSYLRLCSLP